MEQGKDDGRLEARSPERRSPSAAGGDEWQRAAWLQQGEVHRNRGDAHRAVPSGSGPCGRFQEMAGMPALGVDASKTRVKLGLDW